MKEKGGVYTVPATIDGVIKLEFVLDTGATEVNVPMEYFTRLLRTGAVKQGDRLPAANYEFANGQVERRQRFKIKSLRIGRTTLKDVNASIGKTGSALLLGQSALRKLSQWRIDYERSALTFDERGSSLPEPGKWFFLGLNNDECELHLDRQSICRLPNGNCRCLIELRLTSHQKEEKRESLRQWYGEDVGRDLWAEDYLLEFTPSREFRLVSMVNCDYKGEVLPLGSVWAKSFSPITGNDRLRLSQVWGLLFPTNNAFMDRKVNSLFPET